LNTLISMIRTKAVAIFLGPSGVGLVGLYSTAVGFVGIISGLGIASSAVRDIAEADASNNDERVSRSVKALRRACWITGLLGWALTAVFAWPLSLWTFGSGEHAWALTLLGATILLGSISGGQASLLQGRRRIGDLARLNVISVTLASIVSVALYAWLRERGILPVMLVSGAITLLTSWWFARKVQCAPIELRWVESWPDAKRLVQLGLAFMWSGVLVAAVALISRTWIVRVFGLDANGIYQAAWSVSGMFAGFIIGAMGADFYPRLTAVSRDHAQANQLVNEQTEIGILLALPGLLGTLAFAPWVMHVFYSDKFVSGGDLLPWFVLGVFGKVIAWPMSFIMVAKGESRWFAASETISTVLYLTLMIGCMRALGLWGAALAFAILYLGYTVAVYFIARHLTGFHWSQGATRLLLASAALVCAGFAAQGTLPGNSRYIVGCILTVGASVFSLRGITSRLGAGHRIVRMACRLPGGRILCGC
jgi:PST family polysaccharide transporter